MYRFDYAPTALVIQGTPSVEEWATEGLGLSFSSSRSKTPRPAPLTTSRRWGGYPNKLTRNATNLS